MLSFTQYALSRNLRPEQSCRWATQKLVAKADKLLLLAARLVLSRSLVSDARRRRFVRGCGGGAAAATPARRLLHAVRRARARGAFFCTRPAKGASTPLPRRKRASAATASARLSTAIVEGLSYGSKRIAERVLEALQQRRVCRLAELFVHTNRELQPQEEGARRVCHRRVMAAKVLEDHRMLGAVGAHLACQLDRGLVERLVMRRDIGWIEPEDVLMVGDQVGGR